MKFFILIILFAPLAQATQYKSIPGEYVVKLKSEPNAKALNTFEEIAVSLQTHLGQKSAVRVRHFKTSEVFAVLAGPGLNTKNALSILTSDERVAYAEPNYLYHTLEMRDSKASTPTNDAKMGQLWGMQNTGQSDEAGQVGKVGADINVVPVWNEGITGNRSVKVAVIDTGIDYTHPDLLGNADSVNGWNFITNTAGGMDDHNHGTHCAGTIGALGNNNVGVAGVNWNVTIIPVKFLDSQGSGSLENAVQAIQYATKLGVNIMSNSWGGGPFTQSLYDAIKGAQDKGILFVAAAGNDSNDNDASPSYPATYQLDNVISVAATDNRDQIASFSNFGRTKVHVAAPGVKIVSTVKGGEYATFSGTSMATPHVSGIAALLWSTNPSYSFAQIKDILIRTSDKVRGLNKKVVARGRVNVYNAVHGIVPVDNTPAENLWKDFTYSAETPHPYVENKTYSFDINVPNAKYTRVVFDTVDTEAGYDKISIKDANGEEIESLSGTYTGYVTDYIIGGKATLSLKTDASMNKTGFKVQKLQVIY